MNFCPYCGAVLVDRDAPFCAKCGNKLPTNSNTSEPRNVTLHAPRNTGMKKLPKTKNRRSDENNHKKPLQKKSSKKASILFLLFGSRKKSNRIPVSNHMKPPDPQDEGYDGYYNDIKPKDNGPSHDMMDPELLKRIAYVTAGAIALIIISIILIGLL